MNKKLLAKLKQVHAHIQEVLGNNKDLGIKKLERLREEARRSFDIAIESLAVIDRKKIRGELEKKRTWLRQWRIGFFETVFPLRLGRIASMPFIYGMIFPSIIFHFFLEIYHQVCFRLYGIPLVKRGEYFVYDRHLLPYLNWFEKMNCFYCSYVNNLLRYGVEIAGRTERYWCPIKYAGHLSNPHSHYEKFFDYLDAESFRSKWKSLRDFKKDKEKNIISPENE